MRKEKKVVFTMDEVVLMMILVSSLTPDKYKSSETKALIFKCKGVAEGDYDTVGVIS